MWAFRRISLRRAGNHTVDDVDIKRVPEIDTVTVTTTCSTVAAKVATIFSACYFFFHIAVSIHCSLTPNPKSQNIPKP